MGKSMNRAIKIAIYCAFIDCVLLNSALAQGVSISCGESDGYAYFFEGGLVDRTNAGFTEDGISGGGISLVINENGEGDILTIDATGTIKSATSQGAEVIVMPAGDSGVNWMAIYGDGTLEVYSYNAISKKVASYRNTVGNTNVAKNSLFISQCQ